MKTVYLLIEESFRELDSRLLQTAFLTRYGIDVLICQQWWFAQNMTVLPPGVIVYKGNNIIQTQNMRIARKHGHRIASIEEEAFGLLDHGGQTLFDPAISETCDLFLAQSQVQADYIKSEFPEAFGRIAVVGNSRVDILRPPFRDIHNARVNEIIDTHGPFVLINTNFASINPAVQDTVHYFSLCAKLGIIDPGVDEDVKSFYSWCRWEQDNFAPLLTFIKRMEAEACPKLGFKVVLRPHPSENGRLWSEALQGFRHVHVEHDRQFIPWVRASKALVHTGCTTGLEAFFLDRPAFSLQSGKGAWDGNVLSNAINPVFKDVGALCNAIQQAVTDDYDDEADYAKGRRVLSEYLHFDPDEPASSKVADEISKLCQTVPAKPQRSVIDARKLSAADNTGRQLEKAGFDNEALVVRWSELAATVGVKNPPRAQFLAPSVAYFGNEAVL